MRKRILMLALMAAISLGGMEIMAQTTAQPPVAKRATKKQAFHGESLDDDYFWLREKTDKEVVAYLEAENAYTEAMMKGSEAFQEKLYQEMLGR
ncbi:MAG TPA: hypothetical protein VGB76_16375, partial [Pyrinomonadaceae bacterium]